MALIDVQLASISIGIPSEKKMRDWCALSLQPGHEDAEIALRIVDSEEMLSLNSQYRRKDNATNVLSFPSELPAELELNTLGDVVICAPVVLAEAQEQKKDVLAHWAHMVVHGTLHLQGFDHIEEHAAEKMEALETQIITGLGFPAPYSI